MTVGPIANGSTEHKPHEICPWEFCKAGGWTNESIRAAALRVKQEYPGMPGICMYGEKDVVEMNQGGTAAQRSFEAYTAELMKELYPDSGPPRPMPHPPLPPPPPEPVADEVAYINSTKQLVCHLS